MGYCGQDAKSTNFFPMKSCYNAEDYVRLYINEIVRCPGIPLSIILIEVLSSVCISRDPSGRA